MRVTTTTTSAYSSSMNRFIYFLVIFLIFLSLTPDDPVVVLAVATERPGSFWDDLCSKLSLDLKDLPPECQKKNDDDNNEEKEKEQS